MGLFCRAMMKVLICYKSIYDIPKAVAEILSENGIECEMMLSEKAEFMRSVIKKNNFNIVLSSEASVLEKCRTRGVYGIYVAPDCSCNEHFEKADCDLYLVPSKELTFDFIGNGAKDKKVNVCRLPIRKKFMTQADKKASCDLLGISSDTPVFTVFTIGATKAEVRETVKAILLLCPDAQTILVTENDAEKNFYCKTFSDDNNVFVLDGEGNESVCITASDVVFTVGRAETVTAVALLLKPVMLMHTSQKRYKMNSAFFDKRGIGFEGKTAADSVSYAVRLLGSKRIADIMKTAQKKYALSGEDKSFWENFSSFCEKFGLNSKTE